VAAQVLEFVAVVGEVAAAAVEFEEEEVGIPQAVELVVLVVVVAQQC